MICTDASSRPSHPHHHRSMLGRREAPNRTRAGEGYHYGCPKPELREAGRYGCQGITRASGWCASRGGRPPCFVGLHPDL